MKEKPLLWVGSALADLRAFPEDARRQAGHELHQVQQGLTPSDWKPMPSVGASAVEIRIHTAVEHRVFYVVRFEEAVYVLHAFEKKTQKTRRRDIELAVHAFPNCSERGRPAANDRDKEATWKSRTRAATYSWISASRLKRRRT